MPKLLNDQARDFISKSQRFVNDFASSSSSENIKGFVINSAFHLRANALSRSLDEVVNKTTGISLNRKDCLIRIKVSRPSIPGIFISRITRQGNGSVSFSSFKYFNPSNPSFA